MSDFRIQQGTDGGQQWPVFNLDKTPFDFAGHSVVAQIRSSQGNLLHTFNSALGNIAFLGNSILLTWTNEETEDWKWRSGYYQIEVTTPSNTKFRIDEGYVEVIPDLVS